ncbi:MAG: hypothetical protein Q9219_004074, partial [cf. Caloplaca sp. 3 TL-2023]
MWRTRRHKGSCRDLTFSPDGELLFSAGSDGVVKVAGTETGRVVGKVAVDAPTLLHALTPQTLLLATDSSLLHIYDIRSSSPPSLASKPQSTYTPHADYVSSLTPLPPPATTTTQHTRTFLTTGASTAAIIDILKGVVDESEDLGEEIFSSALVLPLSSSSSSSSSSSYNNNNNKNGTKRNSRKEPPDTTTPATIILGGEKGLLHTLPFKTPTSLDPARGRKLRIANDKKGGGSIDAACTVPGEEGTVALGLGNGSVAFARMGGGV